MPVPYGYLLEGLWYPMYIHTRSETPSCKYFFLTCLVSTMAPSGFVPIHGVLTEDTQTKCLGVIPTPWAMTPALDLVSCPLQHQQFNP